MGFAQTQTEEEMLSNYSDQKYVACTFTPSRKLLLGLGKVVHELYTICNINMLESSILAHHDEKMWR